MMRRQDREQDRAFAMGIIDKAPYGVLSVNDEQSPMSVPLSLVREGDDIYFHSGKAGRKIGLLKDGTRVTLVFVGTVKVPDLFTKDQLDDMSKDESKFPLFVSSVFTTEFESAIVEGTIEEVVDEADKVHGLELICQKYTPDKMRYFNEAVQSGIGYVKIFKIHMDQIAGKRKKYARDGHELKYREVETDG